MCLKTQNLLTDWSDVLACLPEQSREWSVLDSAGERFTVVTNYQAERLMSGPVLIWGYKNRRGLRDFRVADGVSWRIVAAKLRLMDAGCRRLPVAAANRTWRRSTMTGLSYEPHYQRCWTFKRDRP